MQRNGNILSFPFLCFVLICVCVCVATHILDMKHLLSLLPVFSVEEAKINPCD